jgi:hypothetical protein
VIKLVQKHHVGSKIVKKYDEPKTPYQRIMESVYIAKQVKDQLTEQLQNLNLFKLQEVMGKKIKVIIKIVNGA